MLLKNISVSDINVREGDYIPETVTDLAESIQENGLYSKLLLRKLSSGTDQYEVIAGGRRLLALKEAYGDDYDLPKSDYIIKDEDDFTALVDSITENVHRISLSPLQLGNAANRLKSLRKGISIKEIAKMLWTTEARTKRVMGLNEDKDAMPAAVVRELSLPEEEEPRFTDAHWDALKKTGIDLSDSHKVKDVCDYLMEHELPASKVGDVVDRFTPKETPAEGNMGPEPEQPPRDPTLVGEDMFVGVLEITPDGNVNVVDKKAGSQPFDLQYYINYAKQSNYRVQMKAKFTIKVV